MRAMTRPGTAATLLPASLLAAVLIAAPFAGTTTLPLTADSRPAAAAAAAVTRPGAPAAPPETTAAVRPVHHLAVAVDGTALSVLVLAYLAIGVLASAGIWAYRRRTR